MLDTNICIYILKNKPESVVKKFKSLRPSDIFLSSITVAELRLGASKSHHPKKNHRVIDIFVAQFRVEDFGELDAHVFGEVMGELQKLGKPIGPMDALIASQAKRHGQILVTNNLREFKRVPKLKLENWV